jgi:hypothetical protein
VIAESGDRAIGGSGEHLSIIGSPDLCGLFFAHPISRPSDHPISLACSLFTRSPDHRITRSSNYPMFVTQARSS